MSKVTTQLLLALSLLLAAAGCKSVNHAGHLQADGNPPDVEAAAFKAAIGDYVVTYRPGQRSFSMPQGSSKPVATLRAQFRDSGDLAVTLVGFDQQEVANLHIALAGNHIELVRMGLAQDTVRASLAAYEQLRPFVQDIANTEARSAYLALQFALNQRALKLFGRAFELRNAGVVPLSNPNDVRRLQLLVSGASTAVDSTVIEVSSVVTSYESAAATTDQTEEVMQMLNRLWLSPESTADASSLISYRLSLVFDADNLTSLQLEYINTLDRRPGKSASDRLYDRASYALSGINPLGERAPGSVVDEAGKFKIALDATVVASRGLVGLPGGQPVAQFLTDLQGLVEARVPADAAARARFIGAMPAAAQAIEEGHADDRLGDEPGKGSADNDASQGRDQNRKRTRSGDFVR